MGEATTNLKSQQNCVLPENDIGHAVGHTLSAEERAVFIQPWTPKLETEFPSSLHTKSNVERRRRLLPTHMVNFSWLAVSRAPGLEGAYCKACVLFGNASGHGVGGRSSGAGQIRGKLVLKPLNRFDHLTGKEGALTSHQQTKYHRDNIVAMEHFRDTFVTHKKDDIRSSLDSAHKRAIDENRKSLAPLVDTVLLCGRQNLALRGHSGSGERGTISSDGKEPDINDGNFRALLRYRIRSGDSALQKHAETAKGNATYQSGDIQNALISSAGSLVKETVLARIKKAKFWAIVADETTDKARREQMAVVIRYVLPDENGRWHCFEDTISILDVFEDIKCATGNTSINEEIRLTGEAIGETLLRVVRSSGLSLEQCIAQGYDGAGSMSSERVGAATHFQKEATQAHYFHCAMHRLNLCAASTITVPAIRNALDTVSEISSFFRKSAKRTELLKDCIDNAEDTRISKKQLKTLCTTRFIERHTAIVCMRSLLRFIEEVLLIMKTTWQSNEARKAASTLHSSICQTEFIISVVILEEVCALMLPLTRQLQAVDMDLINAMSGVDDLLESLQGLRSEDVFSKLFADMTNLAELLGITITKPRIPKTKSVYRAAAGHQDDDAETYFRINYFFPTLDKVTSDIKLRFGPSQQKAAALSCIVPYFIVEDENRKFAKLEEGISAYSDVFTDPPTMIKAEFELWCRKWRNVPKEERPKSAVAALDHASSFPNIGVVLQIVATIPVTTAEAERCFSKLERTLTGIRASMGEKRLESLMMLQIHRSDTPNIDAVIDRFASTAARRLNFLL
jgi:hypothetical protein